MIPTVTKPHTPVTQPSINVYPAQPEQREYSNSLTSSAQQTHQLTSQVRSLRAEPRISQALHSRTIGIHTVLQPCHLTQSLCQKSSWESGRW